MRQAITLLTLVCIVAPRLAWGNEAVTPPNVVLQANATFTRAFQAEAPSPGLAARNLAILNIAIFDAINLCEPLDPLFLAYGKVAPASHPDVAARHAAFKVAMALYPSREGDFTQLRPQSGDDPASVELGKLAANTILNARSDDGCTTTVHYVPSGAPGQWRRTPTNFRPPESPHWGKVTPFSLSSPSQFRPDNPPSLDSPEYTAAWEEVREIGAKESKTRTPEQTLIARFWSDFSYTSTPPGHWNQIACTLADEQKLSLHETARLLCVLNVALADAGIACFDAKYTYNSWRPVTAIQRADDDGNSATQADPKWASLLPCPPHPEYVSGHSTFSAAAATVLKHFFPGDKVTFTVRSDTVPNSVRTFQSFDECVREVGMSRIYAGIHFQFSNQQAQRLGKDIGNFVLNNMDTRESD